MVASLVPASAAPLVLEVARATPGFDQRTGEPMITITLTTPSLLEFAKFTAANVGAKTELRADGKVVASIIIKEPIRGAFQISPLTVKQVADLANRMSTGNATIEVEVVDGPSPSRN
jgi:preprotein translocase subunit SecD